MEATPASRSESYLLQLAERAFLKPWAIPGPAFKAGKEIGSPTNPGVRYMLMTFPPPAPGVSAADHDQWCLIELSNNIRAAADRFGGETIVGLGRNIRDWDDPIRLIRVFDARAPSEADRRRGAALQAQGVIANPEAKETIHIP